MAERERRRSRAGGTGDAAGKPSGRPDRARAGRREPAAGRAAPLAPGDTIELTLDGLAAEGDAVGRYRGMAVFVPWGAPGDRVLARVVEVKPRYARAIPERVLAPAPGRARPACPLFATCGGCRLQHLTYPEQLAWKRRLVTDALERVGRLPEPPVLPTLGMDPPWYYRNKAAVPVRRRPDGRVEMGFFAPGTHRVVDFAAHGCAIQHPVINRVAAALRRWLEEDPAGRATSTYDEARHQGLLRHLVVRVGLRTGEALAGLVINGESLPGEERLARFLCREVPELVGVVKNLHRRPGNVILGDETVLLAGRPWLVDELGGLRFRISLESFYQVNPVQAERLYRVALDYALGDAGPIARGEGRVPVRPERPGADPSRWPGAGSRRAGEPGRPGAPGGKGPWVIDAYAGIGTLALLAAARLGLGGTRPGPGRGAAGPRGAVAGGEAAGPVAAPTGPGRVAGVSPGDGGLAGDAGGMPAGAGQGAPDRAAAEKGDPSLAPAGEDEGHALVTAIEVVPEAIADAAANAALNGIGGVQFLTGEVETILPELARRAAAGGRRPDVILLDPPRKGCEPAALAACLALAPRRIVYVSCNPVTLARDLAVLCDTGSAAAPRLPRPAGDRPRYRLVQVQPVDMFPQTAHVECVAWLERGG